MALFEFHSASAKFSLMLEYESRDSTPFPPYFHFYPPYAIRASCAPLSLINFRGIFSADFSADRITLLSYEINNVFSVGICAVLFGSEFMDNITGSIEK